MVPVSLGLRGPGPRRLGLSGGNRFPSASAHCGKISGCQGDEAEEALSPDIPPGTPGFPGVGAESQDLGVQISGGQEWSGAQCLLGGSWRSAGSDSPGLSPAPPEQVGRHQHQELFSAENLGFINFSPEASTSVIYATLI